MKPGQKSGPPGANLFVFNVPKDWQEDQLKQLFSHYGNVVSVAIMRNAEGIGRGFGFVSYDDRTPAAKAIASLNGFPVPGQHKPLDVRIKKGEEAHLLPLPAPSASLPPMPSMVGMAPAAATSQAQQQQYNPGAAAGHPSAQGVGSAAQNAQLMGLQTLLGQAMMMQQMQQIPGMMQQSPGMMGGVTQDGLQNFMGMIAVAQQQQQAQQLQQAMSAAPGGQDLAAYLQAAQAAQAAQAGAGFAGAYGQASLPWTGYDTGSGAVPGQLPAASELAYGAGLAYNTSAGVTVAANGGMPLVADQALPGHQTGPGPAVEQSAGLVDPNSVGSNAFASGVVNGGGTSVAGQHPMSMPTTLELLQQQPASSPAAAAAPEASAVPAVPGQDPAVQAVLVESGQQPAGFHAIPSATFPVLGPPGANVNVANIPPHWTEKDLGSAFQPYGEVLSISLHRGESHCFGLVSFAQAASSHSAVAALDGFALPGASVPLRVSVQAGEARGQAAPY